jgi:hypothetical protein
MPELFAMQLPRSMQQISQYNAKGNRQHTIYSMFKFLSLEKQQGTV